LESISINLYVYGDAITVGVKPNHTDIVAKSESTFGKIFHNKRSDITLIRFMHSLALC